MLERIEWMNEWKLSSVILVYLGTKVPRTICRATTESTSEHDVV